MEDYTQEFAWLIELSIPNAPFPQYFIGGLSVSIDFSADVNKAIRFSRREDAQGILTFLIVNQKYLISKPNVLEFCKVTEHGWVGKIET